MVVLVDSLGVDCHNHLLGASLRMLEPLARFSEHLRRTALVPQSGATHQSHSRHVSFTDEPAVCRCVTHSSSLGSCNGTFISLTLDTSPTGALPADITSSGEGRPEAYSPRVPNLSPTLRFGRAHGMARALPLNVTKEFTCVKTTGSTMLKLHPSLVANQLSGTVRDGIVGWMSARERLDPNIFGRGLGAPWPRSPRVWTTSTTFTNSRWRPVGAENPIRWLHEASLYSWDGPT